MKNKELLKLAAMQSKKILRLEKELEDEIAGNEFWFLEFKRCEEQKNTALHQIEELQSKIDAQGEHTKAGGSI